jgi:hypothetical protein
VATKDDLVWDQNAFNDIMRRQLGPATEDENGLFYAYDGKLKLGILPVSLFCSGHTYFVQKIYKTTRLQPFAIHTTFQYGGTDGKRHRLREAKVFYDAPEYYDPPGAELPLFCCFVFVVNGSRSFGPISELLSVGRVQRSS